MKCEDRELKKAESSGDLPGKRDRFAHAASLFGLLGDDLSLEAFWMLCHEKRTLADLVKLTGREEEALSLSLNALLSAGLLESGKAGNQVFYQAADTRRTILLHEALENAMEITCPRTANMEDAVEAVKNEPAPETVPDGPARAETPSGPQLTGFGDDYSNLFGSGSGSSYQSSTQDELVSALLGSLLGGSSYGRLAGLDDSNTEFLEEDSIRSAAQYVFDHHIDTTHLFWTRNNAGRTVLSLDDEDWDLVQDAVLSVLYDDGEETLLPGQAHYCPMGHSHSLINRGDCDLKFLAVVPAHHK